MYLDSQMGSELSPHIMIDFISPLTKRKYEAPFSPISPSNKKVKKTSSQAFLGSESPLPNVLANLLQIKSNSPHISEKKRSVYH